MAYLSGWQYYENQGVNPDFTAPEDENWGSYQYVSLPDVVNNFMLMYQGDHELINNISRYQVLFHAKRAIQELNYDAFKEVKVLQLDVSDGLRFVLPPDYVNWIRISYFQDGVLYPLTENIQVNYSEGYLQDNKFRILFDEKGDMLKPEFGEVTLSRITNQTPSIYLNDNSPFDGQEGYCYDGNWYFEYAVGARFGLNTETANANPTFKIDKKGGVINFSSGLQGKSVVLEYVSDGMYELQYVEQDDNTYKPLVDDSKIGVNKMFEEYVYAYIKYAILNNRFGVQEYVVRRAQKDKSALLRNAKIRISNIHPGRLLMNLRGQDKVIK
jgi:hypothetical protein